MPEQRSARSTACWTAPRVEPERRDWSYPIRHDHWAAELSIPQVSIALIQPLRIEKPRSSKQHDD